MTAQELIDSFRGQWLDLASIKYARGDGSVLASLGLTDADTEMVEEAHAIVCKMIAGGAA